MSKRYREVLEEVETPATRRAARHAVDVVAVPVGAGTTEVSVDASVAGDGGVATLVRPTRTRPAAATPTTTIGERPVTMRAPRPGNGPTDADEPLAFAWRGRRYEVIRILGHWREEEGWWRRPDGEPIRIEQSDLWRVEATRGGAPVPGVYELARRGSTWRLDRVWD